AIIVISRYPENTLIPAPLPTLMRASVPNTGQQENPVRPIVPDLPDLLRVARAFWQFYMSCPRKKSHSLGGFHVFACSGD
ncbi:MAG: hypothetical protein ORN49_04125, partial [Rhodobacteraceae bacterium]|nr:hypothetical protein [Paracoccaceae bacterium]